MAKRHPIQPIPPFPDNIDRSYFGAWLSGFVDGEACFHIRQDVREFKNWPGKFYATSAAYFDITIRADDIYVLSLARSFFQCGTLRIRNRTHKHLKGKPAAIFKVHRTDDLATVIVPHFDKFPLLAKKKNDFVIWKEAVLLLCKIKSRPNEFVAPGKGRLPKWTAEETEQFRQLIIKLRSQREYQVVVNGTLNV